MFFNLIAPVKESTLDAGQKVPVLDSTLETDDSSKRTYYPRQKITELVRERHPAKKILWQHDSGGIFLDSHSNQIRSQLDLQWVHPELCFHGSQ